LTSETSFRLKVGQGELSRNIAIDKIAGASPGVIWLGGYRSDMTGTKAQVMMNWAHKNGRAALRFDYSGHGKSDGNFIDGTISRWLEEAFAVFDQHTDGPQILVGSSMGGWIALRLAQELQRRGETQILAGILLIAPAPDFTHKLMEPGFSDNQKKELDENGFISEPSEYSDEPNIITKALIEDGRDNLVLEGIINIGCPVAILQGMKDPDVPYEHAMKLMNHLPSEDVTITLINDGDHRLSREQDLEVTQPSPARHRYCRR
jgi:pimeloyl-ACP methyl ester carboxylesterase